MSVFYQNSVYLAGLAGDDVKFGRAVNGKEYCTFSLLVSTSNKLFGGEETNGSEMIRVVIFNNKRKLVDYLKDMNFHRGMRVSVIGRLRTTKTQKRGIDIIELTVFVIDITVVMTPQLVERIKNGRHFKEEDEEPVEKEDYDEVINKINKENGTN